MQDSLQEYFYDPYGLPTLITERSEKYGYFRSTDLAWYVDERGSGWICHCWREEDAKRVTDLLNVEAEKEKAVKYTYSYDPTDDRFWVKTLPPHETAMAIRMDGRICGCFMEGDAKRIVDLMNRTL